MKRSIALVLLLAASLVGSCQCSHKPDVPPIDEAQATSEVRGADSVLNTLR